MKSLPTESELYESFNDFAHFTLSLIEEAEKNKKKMKLAVVSAQVALELFLKYLFVKKGLVAEIQKQKSGKLVSEFKDFDTILNHFLSNRRTVLGDKKDLVTLLQNRNAIAHSGKNMRDWKDLSCIVVASLFFIHAVQQCEVGEHFFSRKVRPPLKGRSQIWHEGVRRFIKWANWQNADVVTTCFDCLRKTMISAELFPLKEEESEEMRVCLSCFETLDVENQATVIRCFNCFKDTFLVDHLNEQKFQMYVGGCPECGTNYEVRRCATCGILYYTFEHEGEEIERDGRFYCNLECSK